MFEPSRREFLRTTGAVLATGPSLLPRARGESPNEIVNHAVIGAGGRGRRHASSFEAVENCRVVAVSDVDPERMERLAQGLPDPGRVRKHADFRELLDDREIDTVSIATCDHWHVPIALAAILAGKHVYVEKPCSHNVRESNLLAKCAREHGKCVQHGTQRRSQRSVMAGVRALKEGVIGQVYAAKAINHQRRAPIGRAAVEPPPAGVNYDLWLGPAPEVPFTRNRWHYNWHWFWDYGGGDLVNDGIHQLDVAVWGMGLDLTYPDAIVTSGGQLWYDDDHETPDTQTVIYEYPGKQVLYEMRLWTDYSMDGHDNGTVFYGTRGRMEVGRGGVVATVDGERIDLGRRDYGIGAEEISPNFVSAVRADDPARLNSPIEVGAVVTNLCHLGNIGVRTGGIKLAYDPEADAITTSGEGQDEANALLGRSYRKGYELPYTG